MLETALDEAVQMHLLRRIGHLALLSVWPRMSIFWIEDDKFRLEQSNPSSSQDWYKRSLKLDVEYKYLVLVTCMMVGLAHAGDRFVSILISS